MQNSSTKIESKIEEIFSSTGGRLLLNVKETASVITKSESWLDKKRAKRLVLRFNQINGYQVKYRIDHLAAYLINVNDLDNHEAETILNRLICKKLKTNLTTKQVAHIYTMSRGTYDEYLKMELVPSGIQDNKGDSRIFQSEQIVHNIVKELKYVPVA